MSQVLYIAGEEGLKSSLACPGGSKCNVQGTYARLASSQAGFPLALRQNQTFEAESMQGDHDTCDLIGLAHPLECLSLSGCGLANPQPERESDTYSSPAYRLPSPIQLISFLTGPYTSTVHVMFSQTYRLNFPVV